MSDNADNMEIEVKLLVPALASVEEKLKTLGATLAKPRVFESNIRYDDQNGTLEATGTVLRLRRDADVRLTYKAPKDQTALQAGVHKRFEAEISVSDHDTMDTILRQLGYVPSMIYEKYRTTYALDGAEIVLDEMPFGNFVEIEGADVQAVNDMVARLQLSDAPRMTASYATLFKHVKAHLSLTFRDLTFDNFTGRTVSPDAFNESETI